MHVVDTYIICWILLLKIKFANTHVIRYRRLKEQYAISIKEPKTYSKVINDGIRKNILPMKDLEKFIERVSAISLEEYRLKLLKAKENILPE